VQVHRNSEAGTPAARYDKLVVTETADEVLLYDTEKHHIHHLNATTAAVWRLCDGKHTVVDLAREAGQALGAAVDEATVRLALTKLDDAGLLQASLVDELRMSRMSRRTFMQRAGVASAIAVPAIVSTTAAVSAQSPIDNCSDTCTSDANCNTNQLNACKVCNGGVCSENICGRVCNTQNNPCPTSDPGGCTVCVPNNGQSGPGVCGTVAQLSSMSDEQIMEARTMEQQADSSQVERAAEPTEEVIEPPVEETEVTTEEATQPPAEDTEAVVQQTEIATEVPTEVPTEEPAVDAAGEDGED
jgi:hypothetical protein